MHLAAEGGNADVIILLNNAGAPISSLDKVRVSPVLCTLLTGHGCGTKIKTRNKNDNKLDIYILYKTISLICDHFIRRLSELGTCYMYEIYNFAFTVIM